MHNTNDPAMQTPTAPTVPPCPVGDVMRRVQAQLRSGAAPSFEALLAFGEPAVSAR